MRQLLRVFFRCVADLENNHVFVKVYILLKSGVHVWHQVVATALSLISLSKVGLCYKSILQNILKTIFIHISQQFDSINIIPNYLFSTCRG